MIYYLIIIIIDVLFVHLFNDKRRIFSFEIRLKNKYE